MQELFIIRGFNCCLIYLYFINIVLVFHLSFNFMDF